MSAHPRPLPESTFISGSQKHNGSLGGSVAAQAEAMKLAKLREYEAKKEAALTEKLNKAAEAKKLKAELSQQKKLEAQQRKEAAMELKKHAAAEKKAAAELKKQATAEKKAAQLEAKAKIAADKRNLAAQIRAAGAGSSQTEKVSMFDEFRS